MYLYSRAELKRRRIRHGTYLLLIVSLLAAALLAKRYG
jgi:hypothetical protein